MESREVDSSIARRGGMFQVKRHTSFMESPVIIREHGILKQLKFIVAENLR
jgi:hypothetical protein